MGEFQCGISRRDHGPRAVAATPCTTPGRRVAPRSPARTRARRSGKWLRRLSGPLPALLGLCASLCGSALTASARAQAISPDPATVWKPGPATLSRHHLDISRDTRLTSNGDSATSPLSLAQLADLAERHNPETRAAWERARAQAARVGIARSALFPTLAGLVLGQTLRQGVLFGTTFVRQTEGLGTLALELDYTVFDYGARWQALTAAHEELFATNFAFNDTHLRILYQVTDAYYRLLTASGQVDAAEANLENARTVAESAEARLNAGLATLPDALEARAAAAQAEYDLSSLQGARQIAQGDLLTLAGLPVTTPLSVQPLEELAPPAVDQESADLAIERALAERPDLLEQVARIRAADARIQAARAAYLPRVSFTGNLGRLRGYGEQDLLPGTYAGSGEWNAQLNLSWTLFDGGRRSGELARARAERRQSAAELDVARDRAENQVWTAYANLHTAVAQQHAAQTLLQAAGSSYSAAIESYRDGVRTLLDVVAAQRALAQARSQEVTARANLFRETAALAFRTGDLLRHPTAAPAAPQPAPSNRSTRPETSPMAPPIADGNPDQ